MIFGAALIARVAVRLSLSWLCKVVIATLNTPTPGLSSQHRSHSDDHQGPRPAQTRTQPPAATRSGHGATIQRCPAQGRISQATPAAPKQRRRLSLRPQPTHSTDTSHSTARDTQQAQKGRHTHMGNSHACMGTGEHHRTAAARAKAPCARPLGAQVRGTQVRPAAKPQHETNLLQHSFEE